MASEYAKQLCALLAAADSQSFLEYESVLEEAAGPSGGNFQQDSIRQKLTADGGGRHGFADWFSPPAEVAHQLRPLRWASLKVIKDRQLLPQLITFLEHHGNLPPWGEGDVAQLRTTLISCWKDSGIETDGAIAKGQPFCLNLLAGIQRLLAGEDQTLVPHLGKGVPLGLVSPIEPSGI